MLIFAASLAIFVYGIVASMLGTISAGLAQRYHFDNVQTGYMAFAQGVGLVVASVSVGPLLDRRGKKVGLLLGLGLVAASLYAMANAETLGMMVACMLVLGFGGGITITAANALGSDISETKRASVLNFLNVFVGLGGFATPFVAGNLLDGDPVRVAYTAAVLTTGAFLVHAFLKMPAPSSQQQSGSEGAAGLFNQPLLYLLAFTIFLYTACEFGIWNWLVKYLITRGIPQSNALNILSLGFALGLLLGRVLIMPILIKVSALAATASAALLMALTTFAVLHVSTPASAGVLVFCTGLAMAPVFPTTISIVGGLFRQRTSTAIGFTITCGFSGLMVSSPLIGWLSGSDPQGLGKALLLLPIASLIIVAVDLAIYRKVQEGFVANLNSPVLENN